MKKALKSIIKQVGINGLIAIKNDLQRSGNSNLYSHLKRDNLGFTVQNLIFHHLIMVKDFAQFN